MESKKAIIWSLERYEEVLKHLLDFLLQAAITLEMEIQRAHKLLFAMRANPSFMQYANRLIEYFDGEFVLEAYRRLESLVNAGIAPDHAFRMITFSSK